MKASEFTLTESFDSQVNGKLIRATPELFTTQALIGDRTITFNAAMSIQNNKTIWEIEFIENALNRGSTYRKTGSGNEMQVFSFVFDSIKELVARYSPDEIEFSSDKSDGNRTKLYTRLANRIKLPGYTLDSVAPGKYDDKFRIVKLGK